MRYNFDKIVDRKGTDCLKYDFAVERGKPEGVLPLWVADMDFQTAPAVIEQIEKTAAHGIFGYTDTKDDYYRAVAGWYEKHFGWRPEKEWLVKTPGIVFALAAAVRAYTKEGDGVLLQQPVYYPFSEVIRDNDRRIVNSPLKLKGGRYEIDFDDLEEKIAGEHIKLFLMCSPHNPTGRVWEEWELRKIGELCLKYHVTVVSDEIHCDFVYPGHEHHVFASLDERYAGISLICTSPSKTFNTAGLQVSNIWIPNPDLREAFERAVRQTGYSQLNVMGLAACRAAYEEGGEWYLQVKDYLKGNLDFTRAFLTRELPEIHLIEPEGTYLLWLDFRDLKMTEEDREDLILNRAGLWLDSGAIFGEDGEGFERINIACPRKVLEEALVRLRDALGSLESGGGVKSNRTRAEKEK